MQETGAFALKPVIFQVGQKKPSQICQVSVSKSHGRRKCQEKGYVRVNEGPHAKKNVQKSRNSCCVKSGGVGAHGQLTRG